MIIKFKTPKKKKERNKVHSNKIKEILKDKGMTQQELADNSLRGDKHLLSKIINGRVKHISLPTAMLIAKSLGVQVEELFEVK